MVHRTERLAAVALLLVGAFVAQSADAQDAEDIPLLQDYARYNDSCRGGSGDDNETWKACGARDYISFLLYQRGWCYGKDGEASYEMQWHRCVATSSIPMKP